MIICCCPLLFSTCLEQIDLEQIGTEDLLVVEAMITDQLEIQKVRLTRTVALNSNNSIRPESNAQVWIKGDDNSMIDFKEGKDGTYQTEQPFAAKLTVNYIHHFITDRGREYKSAVSKMTSTYPIYSIYIEFEPLPTILNSRGGFFNV